MTGDGRRRRALGWCGHRLGVLLYLGFALFPLFWLVKISVTPERLLYGEGVVLWPSRATLASYVSVLTKTAFPTYFRNSVIVSVATAVLVTLAAAAAGYALSRFRFRLRGPVMFALLLTQMFPLVMLIAPLYRILAPLGLTDSLLGLIIVYTAFNVPFAIFLMQSFFEDIPRELEEAAMIDGARRTTALRRVILPLTLPGIGATLGFVFTAAWSELLFALMLINSDGEKTFAVGLLTFVSKFSVDWGQMMAASVLALIPAVLFFALIQKYLVQGLTAGAVKG
jgi:multiple sugar transport system permease protein